MPEDDEVTTDRRYSHILLEYRITRVEESVSGVKEELRDLNNSIEKDKIARAGKANAQLISTISTLVIVIATLLIELAKAKALP